MVVWDGSMERSNKINFSSGNFFPRASNLYYILEAVKIKIEDYKKILYIKIILYLLPIHPVKVPSVGNINM